MLALLLVVVGLCLAGEPTKQATTSPTLDLVMPGARPSMDDDYLCSAFDVSELSGTGDKMSDVFVTGFVPIADANKAHHMLLSSSQALCTTAYIMPSARETREKCLLGLRTPLPQL